MTNSRQHPWWIFDQFWCRCYDDEVAHDLSQLRTDLAVAHRHCWTLYRETSSALGDKKIVLLSFTNSLHVFFSFSFFFSLSVLCTTIGTQAASIDGFWPTWQPADLNSFTLGDWRRPPDAPVLPSRTWNHWTSPWTKQLMWLRIVHSGERCLCLALRTHSGACQKWLNESVYVG